MFTSTVVLFLLIHFLAIKLSTHHRVSISLRLRSRSTQRHARFIFLFLPACYCPSRPFQIKFY